MPVPAAAAASPIARHAAMAAGKKLSGGHALVLIAAGAAAVALIWAGVRRSPGGGLKVPARATEDVPPFTPPPGHPVLGTFEHLGAVVVSPHRYPVGMGGEITALINGGFATLRIPHSKDMTWLTCPPGNEDL
jgi:hypothetical protein